MQHFYCPWATQHFFASTDDNFALQVCLNYQKSQNQLQNVLNNEHYKQPRFHH